MAARLSRSGRDDDPIACDLLDAVGALAPQIHEAETGGMVALDLVHDHVEVAPDDRWSGPGLLGDVEPLDARLVQRPDCLCNVLGALDGVESALAPLPGVLDGLAGAFEL